MVSLPNATGNFDNFKFNTSDTTMYGLFSQVLYNPITGVYDGDMRLATCDLSTGQVSLISPASVASSYVMAGSSIDPHLMVYYFISEGKLMGMAPDGHYDERIYKILNYIMISILSV
jgi:hypothetical protein